MHRTCLVARGVVLVAAALPMLSARVPAGAQAESLTSFVAVTDVCRPGRTLDLWWCSRSSGAMTVPVLRSEPRPP